MHSATINAAVHEDEGVHAVARVIRHRDRRLSNAGNQRTGSKVPVFIFRRMREHHLGGRGFPLVGDAPVVGERGFGARLRDARLLLQRDRDEGIGTRIARPGFIGESAHPQAVEALALRLQHAEDLDRRVG